MVPIKSSEAPDNTKVAAPMTPEQYGHIRARLSEASRRFGGIDYVSPAFGMVRDAMAEVDRLRAELAQRNKDLEPYEVLNPQQCPAGVHADWLVDSEHTHTCPWCELDRLRAELAARPSVPQQQDRRAS